MFHVSLIFCLDEVLSGNKQKALQRRGQLKGSERGRSINAEISRDTIASG